jgi:hypothetical protein
VGTEIQSPEAEVVEGGVDESNVTVRLKPEKEGQYGCRIIFMGEGRKKRITTPSAEVAIRTFTLPFIVTCCTRSCYFSFMIIGAVGEAN